MALQIFFGTFVPLVMIRKNQPLLHLMEELAATPNMAGAVGKRNVDAGQLLIRQGQECKHVFIIRSGIVKCFFTEEGGKDYIFEFLSEGEILGEIEVLRKQPAFSAVEALTSLELYALTANDFHYLLQKIPAFNQAIMELLAHRVANTSLKSASQQLFTLAHTLPRLLNVLESQGIQFTKQDLSQYLGISVRSLNRLLQQLETASAPIKQKTPGQDVD